MYSSSGTSKKVLLSLITQQQTAYVQNRCISKTGRLISAYIWTHPHWAGVTRISDNLPAQKMLFDIIRIRLKSPALKLLCWKHKSFSLSKLIITLLISNNDLAIISAIQLILQFSPIPKLTLISLPIFFILKVSFLAC